MAERKLASIRHIAEVKPIEGADAIEAVRVDGWWVVAKKNEFAPGDMCVYFEVDSFLPVRDEFEFLRKSCFKSTKHLGDGFRLRTIKLRGQISQGLVLPMDTFFVLDNGEWYYDQRAFYLGDDVTELLGVKKWEPPIHPQLAGKVKGNFPSFIRKTDQERIQNCYDDLVKEYENVIFEATMKLDGSSMTVYMIDGEFGVCSRNFDLTETEENTFWQVARKYKFEELLRQYGKNIALQGELMGPGVQGNREKLDQHEFYLFDIWDINEQMYFTPEERMVFASDYEIQEVPWLGYTPILINDLENILKLSEIPSINNPIAEGIVYRSLDGTVSFKAINNQFLLGEK